MTHQRVQHAMGTWGGGEGVFAANSGSARGAALSVGLGFTANPGRGRRLGTRPHVAGAAPVALCQQVTARRAHSLGMVAPSQTSRDAPASVGPLQRNTPGRTGEG